MAVFYLIFYKFYPIPHSSYSKEISGLSIGIMWGIISKDSQIYKIIPDYKIINELHKHDFYFISGNGGQIIGLIPEMDMVLAVSGDTERQVPKAGIESLRLLDMILEAKIN